MGRCCGCFRISPQRGSIAAGDVQILDPSYAGHRCQEEETHHWQENEIIPCIPTEELPCTHAGDASRVSANCLWVSPLRLEKALPLSVASGLWQEMSRVQRVVGSEPFRFSIAYFPSSCWRCQREVDTGCAPLCLPGPALVLSLSLWVAAGEKLGCEQRSA